MHCFFTDRIPPLGHYHVPSSQQGAPESEGAVSVDRVVAGGQNAQVPSNLDNNVSVILLLFSQWFNRDNFVCQLPVTSAIPYISNPLQPHLLYKYK